MRFTDVVEMSLVTGAPVLTWITAGMPFERVPLIDRWTENGIPTALGVLPDGGLCRFAVLQGVPYLLAKLNDDVMWEARQ